MKSFIAIPLVLAGATVEMAPPPIPHNRRDINDFPEAEGGQCSEATKCKPCAAQDECYFNLRVGRCVDKSDQTPHEKWAMTADDCPDALPKYDLEAGATCAPGYEPLTSSWQDCAKAAMSLGFKGDAVNFVKYNKPWGTTRPEGCFRKGNGEFHFNDGPGGNFKGKDRILCVLEGEGPTNRVDTAGSSLESDLVTEDTLEEAGPEGEAPTPLNLDDDHDGETWSYEADLPPVNDTDTDFGRDAYKFYDPVEGWTKEAPPSRFKCGYPRKRVHHTTGYPWRSIVDMEMTTWNGDKYICTGFFISKRAIMTAAHCLYGKRVVKYGGWVRWVKVCPGRNGNHFPFGCQYVSMMHTNTKWIQTEAPEYDYGMMTLADNTLYNRGAGYFGYTSSLSGVWHVNVAGYPGDIDSGTTLQRSYSPMSSTWRMLKYNADIGKGMSGGPVWAYFRSSGKRRVVGVNAYGGCPNWAVRFTNGVYDWITGFRRDYN